MRNKGRIAVKNILTIGLVLLVLGAGSAGFSDDRDALFRAYSEQNFPKVRKILAKDSATPEFRLIRALTLIHDKTEFQMLAGFRELQALRGVRFGDAALKRQADLALARTAQLIDMRRDLYGNAAADVDFNRIYNEIILEHAQSLEACFAVAYKLYPFLESGTREEQDKAFAELEEFLSQYSGPAVNLAALHLFADDEYVGTRGDYKNGVRHLIGAYTTGITNPRVRQDTLFRIGRYFDHRLGDAVQAKKYYREYVRLYPMSNRAPVVQRLMKELKSRENAAAHPGAEKERQ